MRFLHLSLRSRLYLGFAVLVALGLGTASFGVLGLSGVTASVGKLDAISDNLVRIEEVARRLEVIEGAANRYRTDANANSLNDMRQAETQAAALMTEATKAALSEQRRKLYMGISDGLRAAIAEREAFTHAYEIGYAGRLGVLSGGRS